MKKAEEGRRKKEDGAFKIGIAENGEVLKRK